MGFAALNPSYANTTRIRHRRLRIRIEVDARLGHGIIWIGASAVYYRAKPMHGARTAGDDELRSHLGAIQALEGAAVAGPCRGLHSSEVDRGSGRQIRDRKRSDISECRKSARCSKPAISPVSARPGCRSGERRIDSPRPGDRVRHTGYRARPWKNGSPSLAGVGWVEQQRNPSSLAEAGVAATRIAGPIRRRRALPDPLAKEE